MNNLLNKKTNIQMQKKKHILFKFQVPSSYILQQRAKIMNSHMHISLKWKVRIRDCNILKAFEKKEKSFQGCQIGGYQFKVGSTQVQTKIQKKKKTYPFYDVWRVYK